MQLKHEQQFYNYEQITVFERQIVSCYLIITAELQASSIWNDYHEINIRYDTIKLMMLLKLQN